MHPWICKTCCNESPPSESPPEACPICSDPRQYVPPTGQAWLSPEALAGAHKSDIRQEELGLLGIGVSPQVGIGQRALLIEHPEGGVLWDGVPLLDDGAIEAIRARGGVRAMALSHPHLYGAAVTNSIKLGNVPIYIPEADRAWIAWPHKNIRVFREKELDLGHGVRLHVTGGHFDGSAFLHWPQGAGGRGALLTGDTLFVTPGQQWVTFLWSTPNYVQLPPRDIERIVAAAEGLDYDRIYSGWWDAKIPAGAKAAVARSMARIFEKIGYTGAPAPATRRRQRASATIAHTASTMPNGQAPEANP